MWGSLVCVCLWYGRENRYKPQPIVFRKTRTWRPFQNLSALKMNSDGIETISFPTKQCDSFQQITFYSFLIRILVTALTIYRLGFSDQSKNVIDSIWIGSSGSFRLWVKALIVVSRLHPVTVFVTSLGLCRRLTNALWVSGHNDRVSFTWGGKPAGWIFKSHSDRPAKLNCYY